MRAKLRAYEEAFVLAAQRTLKERGELAMITLFYVVLIVIFSALWHAATESAGGTVGGYSAVALVWYMVGSEAATVTVRQRMIEQICDDITNGTVHTEMLRPVSVIGVRMAAEFGASCMRFVVVVPLGAVLGLTFGGPPVSIAAALLAIPAVLLAMACNVVSQHAFACIGFWQRDARALWFIYQKMIFLVGGMLLPLQLFPSWLHNIAWSLPFWTMAYAPARLLSGHFEPWLLVGQAVWLVTLFVVAAWLFARGENRLQVTGS